MNIKDRLMIRLSAGYLRLVFATGKITCTGRTDLMEGDEKFVVGFWHGSSFCYYPRLQRQGHYIVTTVNRRGDVVDGIGKLFGYSSIRLPDESDPDASLMNLRRMIAGMKDKHACFSMDGPLGPYHIPKRFFLTMALLAKKRIMPISVSVRGKIRLNRRWDKYIIPLPFARITFHYHEPMEVRKDKFDELTEAIIRVMDSEQ